MGLGGGLILAWMQRSFFRIVYESPHFIHIDVTDNKGKPLSITFFYGHLELAKRNEVWQQLKTLKDIAQPSWLCIGDFNQVISTKCSQERKSSPLTKTPLLVLSYFSKC